MLRFKVFLFTKVTRETFSLNVFIKKYGRTTKMWHTSQLSLAARVLWDLGRCSEPHAPGPAFLTAVHCLL